MKLQDLTAFFLSQTTLFLFTNLIQDKATMFPVNTFPGSVGRSEFRKTDESCMMLYKYGRSSWLGTIF